MNPGSRREIGSFKRDQQQPPGPAIRSSDLMSMPMPYHTEEASEQKTGHYDRQKFNDESNEPKSEEDKFKALDDWLIRNGARYPRLELRDYGSEVRGCHATAEIKEEEVIIVIPLKCLITVEMGKDTDIGRAILASNIDLDAPKHIFLMIFMLIDMKNPSSFFKPYYDILPKTLYNMPIFWSEEELKYLEGSHLLVQIEERVIAIETDYAAICHVVPSFRHIATLDEFRWARMCVCSRNFGLMINGVRTAALVPYADMLNHYRPRETKWQYDDSVQGFTVTSVTPIHTGAQVYDSYGQKCNHRFLLNYGFSVENNVELDGYCSNEVPLLIQMSRSDPLFDMKCSIWRRDSALPSRRLRVSVGDNENMRMLLSLLRVIEADKDDVDMLLRKVTSHSSSSSPSSSSHSSSINTAMMTSFRSIRDANNGINPFNEYRAMQHLELLCESYLGKYPNSYESDNLRLASPRELPLFSNERHAVIQVKGEKEVLLFFKDFAVTSQRILRIRDVKSLDEEIMSLRGVKHVLIVDHVKNVIYRLMLEEFQRQVKKGSIVSSLIRPSVL